MGSLHASLLAVAVVCMVTGRSLMERDTGCGQAATDTRTPEENESAKILAPRADRLGDVHCAHACMHESLCAHDVCAHAVGSRRCSPRYRFFG